MLGPCCRRCLVLACLGVARCVPVPPAAAQCNSLRPSYACGCCTSAGAISRQNSIIRPGRWSLRLGLRTSAGAALCHLDRLPGGWGGMPAILTCLQVLADACTADEGLKTAVYTLVFLASLMSCMSSLLLLAHCRCWLVQTRRTMALQLGCSPSPCRRPTSCPGGCRLAWCGSIAGETGLLPVAIYRIFLQAQVQMASRVVMLACKRLQMGCNLKIAHTDSISNHATSV